MTIFLYTISGTRSNKTFRTTVQLKDIKLRLLTTAIIHFIDGDFEISSFHKKGGIQAFPKKREGLVK